MKLWMNAAAMCLALAGLGVAAEAQAPAGAPAGAMGICKDGTYSTQAKKEGACRGHKGVQTWYAADAGKAAATAPAPGAPATAKTASAAPAMQTTAGSAPAGATGVCRDGSYSMQASKEGACRGHKGVQSWYAAAPAKAPATNAAMPAPAAPPAAAPLAVTPHGVAPPPPPPPPAPRPAPATAAAPAPQSAPAATGAATKTATGKRQSPEAAAAARPQAAGGGPGLVWVNTESKVYHCNGDVFYGKTKAGAYMSEADAQAKGAHGERGKTCTGK